MKKFIALVLVLLTLFTLCSCGKETETETTVMPSETETATEIEIPKITLRDDSIKEELDSIIYEYLGDVVYKTSYEENTYYVYLAMENATEAIGSTQFTKVCDSIDSLSSTMSSKTDNFFVFMDKTDGTVLHISYNGKNVTKDYYALG